MLPEILTRLAVAILFSFVGVGLSGQAGLGTLRGRVTDQIGSPIPGAEVTVSARGTGPRRTVKTGSDGEYVVTDVPSGIVTISVQFPGFFPRAQPMSLNNGYNLLDIGLDVAVIGDNEPFIVSGTVRNDRGESLDNVSVTLRNIYQPFLMVQTRTNSTGRFSLLTQKRGDYVLSAALPGYDAGIIGVKLESDLRKVIDFALSLAK